MTTLRLQAYLAEQLPGVDVSIERALFSDYTEKLTDHIRLKDKVGWLWRRVTNRLHFRHARWQYVACFIKEYVHLTLQEALAENVEMIPKELGIQVILTEKFMQEELNESLLDIVASQVRQAFLRFRPSSRGPIGTVS